jgi:hypothetical protein
LLFFFLLCWDIALFGASKLTKKITVL